MQVAKLGRLTAKGRHLGNRTFQSPHALEVLIKPDIVLFSIAEEPIDTRLAA